MCFTGLLRGRRRVEWVLGGDGLLGLEVGRVPLGLESVSHVYGELYCIELLETAAFP